MLQDSSSTERNFDSKSQQQVDPSAKTAKTLLSKKILIIFLSFAGLVIVLTCLSGWLTRKQILSNQFLGSQEQQIVPTLKAGFTPPILNQENQTYSTTLKLTEELKFEPITANLYLQIEPPILTLTDIQVDRLWTKATILDRTFDEKTGELHLAIAQNFSAQSTPNQEILTLYFKTLDSVSASSTASATLTLENNSSLVDNLETQRHYFYPTQIDFQLN